MSGLRVIGLVIVRELRERGLSKSYLVSWLILALLIGAGFAVPALLDGGDEVPTHRLGVVGQDSERTVEAARSVLRDSGSAGTIEPTYFDDREDATRALVDEQVDAVLVGDRELVLGESASPQLEGLVQQGAILARLEEMTASGEATERVVRLISGQVLEVSLVTPQPDENSDARQFLIGQAALVLLFMAIMMTGSWVLLGVTEEKTSRVVEVLLAAVRPWHLLAGKILGVGILGLLQFAVVAGGLVMGIRLVFGADLIQEVDAGLLGTLLLWFVLGYAVYAIAYAAVGAVTSRPRRCTERRLPDDHGRPHRLPGRYLLRRQQPRGAPLRSAVPRTDDSPLRDTGQGCFRLGRRLGTDTGGDPDDGLRMVVDPGGGPRLCGRRVQVSEPCEAT